MPTLRRWGSCLLLAALAGVALWLYWPDRAAFAIKRVGGTVQQLTLPEYNGAAAVTLPGTVTDDDLERMTALDKLHPVWLQLRGRQITGRGLASLKRLVYLRGLTLYGTSISDKDLVHLQAFPELETLNLDGNVITDRGLDELKKLPKLRSISLRGVPVSLAAVQQLQAARPALTIYSRYEPNDD